MRHRSFPRVWLVSCIGALALLIGVAPSTAAPVTINTHIYLIQTCSFTTAFPNCVGVDEYLPFAITYDPADLVLHDFGFEWQIVAGQVEFASPFVGIPSPWAGPTTQASGGQAEFTNNGPGYTEYRTIDLYNTDYLLADSCADGVDCYWETSYRLYGRFAPTPPFSSPPTAADFEALFVGANLDFLSVARYTAEGDIRATYVPGSLLYRARVPEPGLDAMLIVGVALIVLRQTIRTGTFWPKRPNAS